MAREFELLRTRTQEEPDPQMLLDAARALPQPPVFNTIDRILQQRKDKRSERPMQLAGELPQGFRFADDTATELPPGFRFADTPAAAKPVEAAPAPAQTGAGAILPPEDPFERAAIRTMRSATGARPEGAATRALETIGRIPTQEYMRLGGIAKRAIETGDIPPSEALDVALIGTPRGVAAGLGRAVARAQLRPQQLQQMETGVTAVPAAAEAGTMMQAVGRTLAGLPVGGSALRKAAERSTQQLKEAGETAAARPTGTAVAQEVGGGRVRAGLEAAGQSIPQDLKYLLKRSDEDIIGEMVRMAGSRGGADVRSLVQLRKFVPKEAQGDVQSALIGRLGRGTKGEFDPNTWIKNYGGLSDRGKTFLFGHEKNSLRYHLDSIESMARAAPTWQQFEKGRRPLATRIGLGAMVGTAIGTGASMNPIAVLATVLPIATVVRGLSRPVTAAPIAQWSRAWVRFARSGGSPQAIAGLKVATDNLRSNLGADVGIDDFIRRERNGQPLE